MSVYTFIMDYDGGTYVSQVRSSSPIGAARKWAQSFDTRGVEGIGEASKLQMVNEVESGYKKPVPLDGMLNTWFVSFLLRGKLAKVNLVKTDIE
jgi:hypothetical protein